MKLRAKIAAAVAIAGVAALALTGCGGTTAKCKAAGPAPVTTTAQVHSAGFTSITPRVPTIPRTYTPPRTYTAPKAPSGGGSSRLWSHRGGSGSTGGSRGSTGDTHVHNHYGSGITSWLPFWLMTQNDNTPSNTCKKDSK